MVKQTKPPTKRPKNTTKTKKDASSTTYWRVTMVVGFKTYGEGKTQEDAIKTIYDKIKENTIIDEYMYKTQLIKGKAEKPMNFEELVNDNEW
jgi:hypothetical protein